jgi:hypothetical protein
LTAKIQHTGYFPKLFYGYDTRLFHPAHYIRHPNLCKRYETGHFHLTNRQKIRNMRGL